MYGVRVIYRKQEGICERLIIFVIVKAKGIGDATEYVFQEIPVSALRCQASHFLIIEASRHANSAVFLRVHEPF